MSRNPVLEIAARLMAPHIPTAEEITANLTDDQVHMIYTQNPNWVQENRPDWVEKYCSLVKEGDSYVYK